MRWKTLLVLVALFCGLGFLYRLRSAEEASGKGSTPVVFPVLPGFAQQRVSSLRIDNLERAVQLKLERDTVGNWFMTDPLAYPAEEGMLVTLFRTLSTAMGEPSGGIAPEELQLDPPRAVLELVQQGEAGPHTFRMDVGGVDLDQDRIYVRVYDHPAAVGGAPLVLRASRAIHSLIDHFPAEYRSRRTTELLGQDVIAVKRSGTVFLQDRGGLVDLALEADRGDGHWRTTTSPVVSLEPNAVGLVAVGAAGLRVERFTADQPSSWKIWGLEPPVFSIELSSRQGVTDVLDFGYPRDMGPTGTEPDAWFARRRGLDHVWEVDARDVQLLMRPVDDLYDQLLIRSHREDLVSVRLEAEDGRVLLLERVGDFEKKTWTVREEGSDATPFLADFGRVRDVISAIESAQLEYPEGIAFDPALASGSIQVTNRTGLRFGGRLGRPYSDPQTGLVGRVFLRTGDELPAVAEETVSELVTLGLGDFRSDIVHQLRPADVYSLALTYDGRTFTYLHPTDREWVVSETRFDAPKDLTNGLDTLLRIRAEEWLDGFDDEGLTERVRIDVTPKRGAEPLSFTLGRLPDGGLVCLGAGHAAQVSERQLADYRTRWGTGLHEGLVGLFAE